MTWWKTASRGTVGAVDDNPYQPLAIDRQNDLPSDSQEPPVRSRRCLDVIAPPALILAACSNFALAGKFMTKSNWPASGFMLIVAGLFVYMAWIQWQMNRTAVRKGSFRDPARRSNASSPNNRK